MSDSSETDTITKSLGLAGIGWEAGINWPLSATKKTKTTSKWGDIVPGPHALFRASLYPGLTLQNPKASLDSLSYHQRISIAPDQALGQPQRLPDEYNFVCATKLPPQGWLCNQPSYSGFVIGDRRGDMLDRDVMVMMVVMVMMTMEVKVKSLSRVQLCDPVDCSLLGSSLHGILQARILEWVAISFSRGVSQPRDQTQVSRIGGRCFTT